MPRTDDPIRRAPSNGGGKHPLAAVRPPKPAEGCDGGKGKGTGRYGSLLLPLKSERSFTPLRARFITEYLKDPTAPQHVIAVRAGFSEHTAKQQASQLMKDPDIQAEIHDQMHAFVQRERLSIQRLVRHLIELAEVDKRDYHNEDGSLKSPKEWTKPMAALVKGFTVSEIWDIPGAKDKVQTGELKKITLTDHLSPITMLTKSLQGFLDTMTVKSQSVSYHKHEHTVNSAEQDIDFTVLSEDELMVMRELYSKARRLTKEKRASAKGARVEGRA